MTPEDQLYRFRLRVIALAEELGDVRAACRTMGVHPSSYYRWKRPGAAGLLSSDGRPARARIE